MADKYDLPPYVLSRVRYYDGEYLKDDEFIDEQKYHIDRRQRHDRLLHVAGVCEGLTLGLQDPKTLKIAAGTAIDDQGHTILLDADVSLAVKPENNGALFVELLFAEKEDRPADNNSAVASNTRFSQAPVLQLTGAAHPHGVILGQAAINAGVVSAVTGTGRVYSGLRMPGPGNGAYALHARGDAVPGLVDLECSLNVTGTLQVSGSRLKNKSGLGMLETDADDWLRVNPDQSYPGIALHKAVAIGTGGLSIGDWTPLPPGQLKVTGDASVLGALGFGAQTRQMVNLWNAEFGIGVQSVSLYLRTYKNVVFYKGGTHNDAEMNPGAGGTAMLAITDGSVGIGTTAPAATLSVAAPGVAQLDGTIRNSVLLVTAGSLGNTVTNELALATIGFRSGNNTALGVRAYRNANGTDWGTASIGLGMDVDNYPRAGACLWLSNIGVGIGTPKPAYTLQVAGTGFFDGALRAGGYAPGAGNVNAFSMEVGGPDPNGANGRATLFLHHHGVIAHQLRYNSGSLYLEAAGNGYGTSPTPHLVVGGNVYATNVGIGTSAPAAALSVVVPNTTQLDGNRSSVLLVTAGSLGNSVTNEIALASIGFRSGNNTALGVRAYRNTNGTDWYTASIGLGMDVDNIPRAGACLWLSRNGVGVGNANPKEALDVAGNVAVAGNIALTGKVRATGLSQHHNGNGGASPNPHHMLVLGDNGAWDAQYNRLFLYRSVGSDAGYSNEISVRYATAVPSSRSLKTEIKPVAEQMRAAFLTQIMGIDLVHYRLKHPVDADDDVVHLGIIAEDAPDEIVDKKRASLEISDYCAFLLAGIQALKREVDELRQLAGSRPA